jgi:ribose 5-phosphate isomerase B
MQNAKYPMQNANCPSALNILHFSFCIEQFSFIDTLLGENHMRVGIATDHGGYTLKVELAARLQKTGQDVVDFGATKLDSADDYPDFVIPLARSVVAGEVERGIAVCGSGVGASYCANKVAGVRAALVHDHFTAHQGVEDDHMNVLCLGGRIIGPELAWEIVETFLAAKYSDAERHLRRLSKVAALENT